jgi:hypothetical protein
MKSSDQPRFQTDLQILGGDVQTWFEPLQLHQFNIQLSEETYAHKIIKSLQ